MTAARAARAKDNNWIMGIHPVSAEVANGLIEKGLALLELGGIDTSDIGIICSATRNTRG